MRLIFIEDLLGTDTGTAVTHVARRNLGLRTTVVRYLLIDSLQEVAGEKGISDPDPLREPAQDSTASAWFARVPCLAVST
jgi:hypothetical protein